MTGPLAGVRGIVITQAWAGAFCTEMLGLLGADIIQIEVRKRPDSWRGDYHAPIAKMLQEIMTAEHPWNCNALYNSVNLNKRCITLDLATPDGLDVFKRLLPFADVVAENFSPRVLGNLGLGYEVMREINPRVILCSLSAYGRGGLWENVPGIGGTIEPASGMSALLGYSDGPPMNSGQMYPDAVAGLHALSAILTALHHRNRTGRGQYIDLSMQEANLVQIGDAALEYQITGAIRGRMGNRHYTFAPHGMFRCAGNDRWLALACESDAQWKALGETAAGYAWPSDSRFATNAARKANEDALEAAITAWTVTMDRDSLVSRLRAAGVIAAPVLTAQEVAADRGLRERGVVVEVEHEEAGKWPQVANPLHFSRTPVTEVRPAPLLGQHTSEVLRELLGIGQEEYERLVAAGISGMGPPD